MFLGSSAMKGSSVAKIALKLPIGTSAVSEDWTSGHSNFNACFFWILCLGILITLTEHTYCLQCSMCSDVTLHLFGSPAPTHKNDGLSPPNDDKKNY